MAHTKIVPEEFPDSSPPRRPLRLQGPLFFPKKKPSDFSEGLLFMGAAKLSPDAELCADAEPLFSFQCVPTRS